MNIRVFNAQSQARNPIYLMVLREF